MGSRRVFVITFVVVALLVASQATVSLAEQAKTAAPTLRILGFHKQVEPGRVAAPGTSTPTFARIALGDEVTLVWTVEACRMQTVRVRFDGAEVPGGTRRELANGCFSQAGERSVRPDRTHSYVLNASGTPNAGSGVAPAPVDARFEVQVLRPVLDVTEPTIDQNTMRITFHARNRGDADFSSSTIALTYRVNGVVRGPSPAIHEGTLRADRIAIPAGRTVDLGAITLPDRARALAYDNIVINVELTATYSSPLDPARGSFPHRWEQRTFTLTNGMLGLISMGSSYDIRLNNFRSGAHVANDSHINLSILGNASNLSFNIPRYTHEVLIAVPPSPIPIKDDVAIYVNQINAAQRGPTDLFFIRDGKFGIRVAFPNPSNSEIKTGILFGSHDEFKDDWVADVDISPFTLEVLLTPTQRGNSIGYSRVEVQANNLDTRLCGALDKVLQAFFGDYLRDYVRNTIVTYLTQILDQNDVRTSIERGLNDAMRSGGASVTRLLSVRASGDQIILTYL